MKREATLKAAVMRELARQCPQFLVLQLTNAGAPDRAIVGGGRTSYWEFKHGTPGFVSHDNQELFCMRLNVQDHCRYVVWQEAADGRDKRTLIVIPHEMHRRKGWRCASEASCQGFDIQWLVQHIRKVHGV